MVPMSVQDEILRSLGKSGHRLTRQRQAVLKILFQFDREHMTVEELYDRVKGDSPQISIATVYKTVLLLENAKIMRRLQTNDKCGRYELIHPDEQRGHPHLVCTRCGKTVGIVDGRTMELLDQWQAAIREQYHFDVHDQSILFYGLCRDCSRGAP